MSNTSSIRNEIKQVAKQIESLAQQVQENIDRGQDIIGVSNELARNSSTFVFTLGALYGLEEKTSKKVKATAVSNPNKTASRNYYSIRDTATGRFVKI